MKKTMYVFLMVVGVVALVFGSAGSDVKAAPPHPDVRRVVYVSGSHYDMGYQYGQQAGDYVEVTKPWFWMMAHGMPFLRTDEHIMGDLARYEAQIKKVAPELLEEMRGVADGAKAAGYDVTYRDVLLINCWFEMGFAHPSAEVHTCSSFGAWGSATQNGAPMFAQNRDSSMYPFIYEFVLIAYPEGKHAFMTQATGGLLAANWGMNDQGLSASCQTGPKARGIDRAFGMAHMLMIQKILESCSTAEEAKDYILNADIPKSRGNNYIFLDKQSQMYVVETTAADQVVRRATDFGEQDFMVATNHFLTEKMQGANKRGVPGGPSPDSFYRYASVYELVNQNLGKITPGVAMDIMCTHSYWDGNQWVDDPSTGRSPCKHDRSARMSSTITANIVFPKGLTVDVSTGNPCGTWPWDGLLGYAGYVELELKGSPRETTTATKNRAANLVSLASDLLRTDKLEASLVEKIQKAQWEYVEGCTAETLSDYSDATTHFSKAQAYARYAINKGKKQ